MLVKPFIEHWAKENDLEHENMDQIKYEIHPKNRNPCLFSINHSWINMCIEEKQRTGRY